MKLLAAKKQEPAPFEGGTPTVSGNDLQAARLRLGTLFDQIRRLPSVPKLYTELLSLINSPESSMEEIGKVISRDMAMTAMILKTVNTAPFGLRSTVVSATQAAIFLGIDKIRALALSLGVFSQFKSVENSDKLYIESVWEHSVKVATKARAIVKLEGLSEKKGDEAFAAGLLHDIGKLVLADNFPGPFRTALAIVRKEGEEQFKAEKIVFGASHAKVGGGILLNWKLPLPIGMAVYLHHTPSRAIQQVFGPLTAVHVADALEQDPREDGDSTNNLLDTDHLERLGLMNNLPSWREAMLNIAD